MEMLTISNTLAEAESAKEAEKNQAVLCTVSSMKRPAG